MNEYNTNIVKLTCSCLDWQETRQQYSYNDPRRLCKHIINKVDVNNLPTAIFKFKKSIEFYQNKGWGFKRNFDEVIELENYTLLTDTYMSCWIDVFDENGIRYSVLRDEHSDVIYWAKQSKPERYEIIEKLLLKEYEKIPLYLQKEEYSQVINFIKEVLPHKKELYITIDGGMFPSTRDGVIYNISESKMPKEEAKSLERELLEKYDLDKAYSILAKATVPPINDLEKDEFDIFEALRVTNNEFILTMYGNNQYKLKRDYEFVKERTKEIKLQNELKKEREEKENKEFEQIRQKELKLKRESAQKKGYLLSEDYTGNIYDIQNECKHPKNLSWDEFCEIQDKIFNKYDTLSNLIKKHSLNTTTTNFNKVLKELDFIRKDSSLNLNQWIIHGNGLSYGINLIKESKYMHKKIPDWYKVHIFNSLEMKLVTIESNTNIKMTSALFSKHKFNELYNLYKEEINKKATKNNIIKTKKTDIISEREKWLRHVTCPNCGENKNIHKKDKRKRNFGYIQRFYCNECNSMFQIDLDKLEKMIQNYTPVKNGTNLSFLPLISETKNK